MTGPAVLILASALGTVLIARQSPVSVADGTKYATVRTAAGHPPGRSGPAYSADVVTTAARVRTQAAGWIAQQVSPGATVSCDPAMCTALRAAGIQPVTLLVLPSRATEPLSAGLVVATAAVRNQFGARLAAIYAPEVIARFGSGTNAIQVRYVPPDGASSFEAGLAPGRAARIAAGLQLLHNQHVTAAPAASAVLSAGDVDPRLLVTLAALAAQQGVSVAAFGDASPGAAEVPLRQVEIGPGPRASMQAMLAFLRAQQPPYLPARAGLIRVAGGLDLLTVQFDAPSPPGLIP
jgi:hypothetical protein